LSGASDEELIGRSVAEPEAFGEIFERHHDAVYAYLRRRVGPDAGEELTSQTFVVALSRRASYKAEHDSCRPWLVGIAHRLVLASAKHRRVEIAAVARLPVDVHEDPDPSDRLDAQRILPQIREALERLSEADRETLVLYALGDLRYAEVAWILDVPVGTVRSRIHRARAVLREPLGRLRTSDVEESDGGDHSEGGTDG